jgi:hypothetical protein
MADESNSSWSEIVGGIVGAVAVGVVVIVVGIGYRTGYLQYSLFSKEKAKVYVEANETEEA